MANSHTPEQRDYIVRRLAAFYTPPEITAEFALRFPGATCDENDVLANDPTRFVVPPELFEAFKKERERVLLDPSAAPFADQAARLIVLSRQVADYQTRRDFPQARAVLRQIAEEKGDVGTKGTTKDKGQGAPAGVEEVTAITRTIVDPVTDGTDPRHTDAEEVPPAAT